MFPNTTITKTCLIKTHMHAFTYTDIFYFLFKKIFFWGGGYFSLNLNIKTRL